MQDISTEFLDPCFCTYNVDGAEAPEDMRCKRRTAHCAREAIKAYVKRNIDG